MILYVRSRGRFINFVHSVEEFKMFQDSYIPGTPILLGDISMFNSPMKVMLLKFIEENSNVSCYSSQDITDPVLLSRFVQVIKEPLVPQSISVDELRDLDKSYETISGVSLSATIKLHLYHAANSILNILQQL